MSKGRAKGEGYRVGSKEGAMEYGHGARQQEGRGGEGQACSEDNGRKRRGHTCNLCGETRARGALNLEWGGRERDWQGKCNTARDGSRGQLR